MKYLLSLFVIILVMTSCQKKVEINYDNSIKEYKVKDKIEKIVIDENIIELDKKDEIIIKNENETIAILYASSVIGKYSVSVSNIVSSYAFNSAEKFNFQFINLRNENLASINNEFKNLKENNITKVLFFLSPQNSNIINLITNISDFDIYLPLINKLNNEVINSNVIYGGIDYKKQLDKLKSVSTSHIIEIYDDSYKSRLLHDSLDSSYVTSYALNGKYPNYSRFIKNHKNLKDSSLILNMNIIKSSIFLSQISASDDLNISQVLSTQSVYSPLLFVLTQTNDTKNLIIANSIIDTKDYLNELSNLLGNDLRYDWVNYSTILGLEYLKHKSNLLFDTIKIIDSQVDYPIKLYKTRNKSFLPLY